MLSQVSIIYHRHICVGCSQLRKIERAAEREAFARNQPLAGARVNASEGARRARRAVTLC